MFFKFSGKVLGLATLALAAVVTTFKAEAHSDYWRCAVRSGSNEAAAANCGSRADYDRRVADEARRRMEDDRRRNDNNRGGFNNGGFNNGNRGGFGRRGR